MTKNTAKSLKTLTSALDGNPEIRKALITRLTKAAETAPVVILHQICMMLEMNQR